MCTYDVVIAWRQIQFFELVSIKAQKVSVRIIVVKANGLYTIENKVKV